MNLSNEGRLENCVSQMLLQTPEALKFAQSAWLFCFPVVFVVGSRFYGGFALECVLFPRLLHQRK